MVLVTELHAQNVDKQQRPGVHRGKGQDPRDGKEVVWLVCLSSRLLRVPAQPTSTTKVLLRADP